MNKKEVDIALKLPESIKENDLISRDLPSLDRIIEIYFEQKNLKKEDEKEVVDFLFYYLDKHGPDGSVLFRHLKRSSLQEKVLQRLHDNYQGKFNFDLVNSTFFESSYQSIQTMSKLKIITFILTLILFTYIFKYEYTKNCNDKRYEINQIQQAQKNEELNTLIEQMKEKISTLERLIEIKNSRMVGEFFYSFLPPSIVEPKGAIHAGGAKKDVNNYTEFINKYIKSQIIPSVEISKWKQLGKDTGNNVMFFGYTPGDYYFYPPNIQSCTFLSNAWSSKGEVDGKKWKAGEYHRDQIVNIKGKVDFSEHGSWSSCFIRGIDGCFEPIITLAQRGDEDGNWGQYIGGFNFDASKSQGVNVGEMVTPRTIFAYLYMVTSDHFPLNN